MSNPIRLGKNATTGEEVRLSRELFRTHMHLIGATGAGKTSAIHTILRPLLLDHEENQSCVFVLDPMGNLSHDLLRLIANERYCPPSVRDRLVYIEPSRDDFVVPFNPLENTTDSSRYYQTMRAVDLVLRAWEAQDVSQQPRLLQWTYKAFCAAAKVGFPISVCQHLVHPGSEYHTAILDRIPGDIRHHWQEILNAKGSEPTRILESTRNRLDPFFESPSLRYMFGVQRGRFDCERLIKERKIVIVNLAKQGRLPGFIGDTIGALVLNEIFETANAMRTTQGKASVDPTYILLDEFQRYVSVDVEEALPTVRQMGLRMILAHQSFAQLDREDVNLEQMIWQARTRLIFSNYAKDADLLADELAKLTFDKMRIKEIRRSKRQLIEGYRKEWLCGESESSGQSSSSGRSRGSSENESRSATTVPGVFGYASQSHGGGEGTNNSDSDSSGYSGSSSRSRSESLVPIHKSFEEITSVTYESFEEQSIEWGQRIRSMKTGEAILQRPGTLDVEQLKVNYMELAETRESDEAVQRLLQKNFESDFFISTEQARQEHEQCLDDLLSKPILTIESNASRKDPPHAASDPTDSPSTNPFEL